MPSTMETPSAQRVDQVAFDQRMNQVATAIDQKVAARLVFKLGDLLATIFLTSDQG
jgi:hypothetical protein